MNPIAVLLIVNVIIENKPDISSGHTVTYITYDKIHTIPASPIAAISDVCGSVWVLSGVCEVRAVCAVSMCECVFSPIRQQESSFVNDRSAEADKNKKQ